MISQLNIIRSFVDRKLADLTTWAQCTGEPGGNADHASATVVVKDRRYRLACTSAYVRPALGELSLIDLDTHHEIRGGKTDALWSEIEAYLRRRANDQPEPTVTNFAPVEPAKPAIVYADERKPYLGQGVTFICERGEPVGGMTELAAIVTEIIAPTVITLTIFPKTGEHFWRNDLPRRSTERMFNCWDFSEPAPMAGDMTIFETAAIARDLDKPRRGPGRPPKAAAA